MNLELYSVQFRNPDTNEIITFTLEDYFVKNENGELLPKNSEEYIYVEPQKVTRVEFPLKSSVGNITGKLQITDDFNRKMNITDFIVSLYDQNGTEVAYSTVDDSGNYYFSGIAPGQYKVMLDKNFINDYSLVPDEHKGEIAVNIPYIYKNFVEFKDQNLIYKCF